MSDWKDDWWDEFTSWGIDSCTVLEHENECACTREWMLGKFMAAREQRDREWVTVLGYADAGVIGNTPQAIKRLIDQDERQADGVRRKLIDALWDLREAATDAYKSGRIEAEPFVRAGNVLAELGELDEQ